MRSVILVIFLAAFSICLIGTSACRGEVTAVDGDRDAGGEADGDASGEADEDMDGDAGGDLGGDNPSTADDGVSSSEGDPGGDPDPAGPECENWQARHPDWIFCDDFESGNPAVGTGSYFEYADNGGDFIAVAGVGFGGSTGMRVRWQTGEVDAGSLKLAFGRNPNGYMNKGIRATEDFREIYYRMYLKMQDGWQGNPAKLSRVTIFTAPSAWDQAMIAHIWNGSGDYLKVEPVRCVDSNNQVKCHGYNDFDNMDWLGGQSSVTPVFATANSGRWLCVEAYTKLNDPGASNGVQELWIDGSSEARKGGLDFVRSYQDYGLNAVFFENHWNSGSVKDQERYFDNLVISTTRIGCL